MAQSKYLSWLNRKVKGIILPTDTAIRCFFERHDFEYIDTFHRSIPNKRMSLRNSPTNAPGVVENTMQQEYIVVLRRKIPRTLRERTKSKLLSTRKRHHSKQ